MQKNSKNFSIALPKIWNPKIHPWIFGFLTRILQCKILALLLLHIHEEPLYTTTFTNGTFGSALRLIFQSDVHGRHERI